MIKKPDLKELDSLVNPFESSLEILVVRATLENQYTLEEEILSTASIEMEYTPYCKLYAKSEHRKIINKCSPCTKELFLWIMYTIEHGKDYIWINKQRYMEECSVSYKTYKKALSELGRYGLITSVMNYKDTYWIHPDFFFKGNRVAKYSSRVKEYIPKTSRKPKNKKVGWSHFD